MINSKRLIVGLLDSYTGGNFGDGAVQDAVIKNVIQRMPDCTINLITLNPTRTTEIHGFPSYPISTDVFLSNQSKRDRPAEASSSIRLDRSQFSTTSPSPGSSDRRSQWYRAVKKPLKFAKRLVGELRHLYLIFKLLRNFRLLIISGGGQLDDYWGGPMGHPYVLLKWTLLARLTGVRVVFLSVGVDRLEHRLSRSFIKLALRSAVYRSYRDAGSKSLLADLPFTLGDPITPDLAFSFDPRLPNAGLGTSFQDRPLRIGISPMAYMLKGNWPRENAEIFQPYFDSLVTFTARLLDHGHSILLFATADADNVVTGMLRQKLMESLPEKHWARIRRIQVGNLRALIPEIAPLDFIVASRLHGVILPHVCRLPVLAISYDRKVTSHMHTVEQDHYCLDIHTTRAEQLTKTWELMRHEIPSIRKKLTALNEVYGAALADQYDHMASLLKTGKSISGS